MSPPSIHRIRSSRRVLAAAGLAASLSIASGARAADLPPMEPQADRAAPARDAEAPPPRNWSLILGAGGVIEPEYEGGKDIEVSPVPLFLFTYGDWLEVDPSGLEARLFEYGGLSFSALAGYESGRDEDDHERLDGLGDIDFAATVGGKAAYESGAFELYGTVEKTIEGSEGLIGSTGISFTAPVSEQLILGADAKATFADDNHMEAYFGVDASQAAASGLAEYEAEAGLKRVDLSASATYLVTDSWLVRGEAGIGILTGDAADSPVVEEELQPQASLFLGYKF